MKMIVKALTVLCMVIIVMAGLIRYRYGGGSSYPDLTGVPLIDSAGLEIVATLSEPPGNIAVSENGRIFLTIHPESKPDHLKVVELVDGKPVAFPDEAAQRELYHAPQGIRVDRQNRVWTIDHADNGLGQPRLVAVDLDTRTVVHRYDFPSELAGLGSYFQDLCIDPAGETVYIADVGFWKKKPGILVYNVNTRTCRRILDKDSSVMPMDYVIATPAKKMVFFAGLAAMKPGVDGIALDQTGTWLYYAAMTHDYLYRIRTSDIRSGLSPGELSNRVERVGRKPLSDGISVDSLGQVYLTDVEHSAVMLMDTTGSLTTIIKDRRIRWADGFSFGPERWLYLADSDIPDLVLQSKEHVHLSAPFHIFRFAVPVGAFPGQ